ncbi:MAG: metallophosphoesterase [Lachnospiraceae bacterium]|jgi:predicted phosphohydrolase
MSLYAIGDLHLHFGTDRFPKLQETDPDWAGHEEKVKRNCARLIGPEDTLVLVGDHTWGRDAVERRPDFEFIEALPGRKILTRGNHDMFWEAKHTDELRQRYEEMYDGGLEFVQASFTAWRDYALVATKGYTYEGLDTPEHAEKLVRRELGRLKKGLDEAQAAGFRKIIIFLHYPPTNILERESGFTRMAEDYGAEQVVYAHCHGRARFHDSIRGMFHGVYYSLVSGDSLDWCPKKIVE